MTPQERVGEGAALLDRTVPDWETKIDLANLVIWDGCRCILGQLYGTYFNGTDMLLDEDDKKAAAHGFAALPYDPQLGPLNDEWEELQQVWETTIKERINQ